MRTIHSAEPRHDTLDNLWVPPLPSLATRKISLKSRGAGRSHVPVFIGGTALARLFHTESLLETKVLITTIVRADIANIVEQPRPVDYFDEIKQSWQKHYFDFYVTKTDGTTIAIAVRPQARAESVERIVKAIAAQVYGYADYFALVKDSDITNAMVKNAGLILSARRDTDHNADDAVRAITITLNGDATIASIVAATGLEGNAFRAIVRLIDAGELVIDRNVLINYQAKVRCAQTMRAAA